MRPHLVLAIVAATGCDWDFNRMNNQPRCEPGDSRPWLPDHRCDQRAPLGTVQWHTATDGQPEVTRELILRGRDRFSRICAPCHGPLGDGNSAIAEDMMLRRPPSLLIPPVTQYPNLRIFDVISHGYGLMPAYSFQLSVRDRWAIVHFVRVLERSQQFPLAELPAQRRQEAQRWLQ